MSNDNKSCHIVRIEYANEVKLVQLKNAIYSIGRSPDNAIVINHNKVSREHCVLVPAHDKFDNNDLIYYIVDGSLERKPSSNGLFVDLKIWTLKHRLRTGDVIGIGTREVALTYYKFSLRNPEDLENFCNLQGKNKCSNHPEVNHMNNNQYHKQNHSSEVVFGKDFIVCDSWN